MAEIGARSRRCMDCNWRRETDEREQASGKSLNSLDEGHFPTFKPQTQVSRSELTVHLGMRATVCGLAQEASISAPRGGSNGANGVTASSEYTGTF